MTVAQRALPAWPWAAVIAALCALPLVALAQGRGGNAIYRCLDPFGQVTIQNGGCPKGTKQDKVVSAPAPSVSAPPPSFPPVAPAVPANAVNPANAQSSPAMTPVTAPPAEPLPLPPFYQCFTYDSDSYYTEDAEPKERCVALQSVGIDGSAQLAAGQSCEVQVDKCQRVGDKAACDAWKQWTRQMEAAWKFGPSEKADANRKEYERVKEAWDKSGCATPPP